MPKPAPPKRLNWRLAVAILTGLLLFVSTAMAARRVQSMLLSNERFFLMPKFESGDAPAAAAIHVEGNRFASTDRIALVFAPDLNRSIFSIPLAERRRRLLAIDWVEDASVLRVWPNQVIVRVRERHPVAFAKLPFGVAEPVPLHAHRRARRTPGRAAPTIRLSGVVRGDGRAIRSRSTRESLVDATTAERTGTCRCADDF